MRAHLPTLSNISVFLWSPGWKEYFNMCQATEKGKHFWPSCTVWFFAVSKFPFYVITCLCPLYPGIFIQYHPFHNARMQVSLHGQKSCSVPLSLTHTKCKQCLDYIWILLRASLVAQRLKHLPPMQETRVRSRQEYSSILAWRIPWTEKPRIGYSPRGYKESDTTERLHFTSSKRLLAEHVSQQESEP